MWATDNNTFAYPAGDPSVQVTETFFRVCNFMSGSSFCAEHAYSDCVRFFICTTKLSMLASTAVKSNGKLSAPSNDPRPTTGWCCCWRRFCARPPCKLLASPSELNWIRSRNSEDKRIMDRPGDALIIPGLCMSDCYWKTSQVCVRDSFESRETYTKILTTVWLQR